MTRKSFGIRHLKAMPPDEQTAARYLLTWHGEELFHERERFPGITSEQLFGNSRSLELEIGCGTGDFICSLAAMEPAVNLVGLDISQKSLHIAVEKARSLSLDNIKFIKAPVQLIYPLMQPNSLAAVYLHFPDPCLRPKFRPRRIFTPAFLDEMHRVLRTSGRLSIMTDVEELFNIMLALIEKDSRFEKTHSERYLVGFGPGVGSGAASSAPTKSRYQTLWERHGYHPLRFEVRKREA